MPLLSVKDKDRRKNQAPPVVAAGLALTLVLLQTGCAQIRSYTAKDWPSIGSKESIALREEKTPGQSTKGDIYAKSLNKPDALPDSVIAGRQRARRTQAEILADDRNRPEIDRVSAGQTDVELPSRTRSTAPMVVLQRPEALPAFDEAGSLADEPDQTIPITKINQNWAKAGQAPPVVPETLETEPKADVSTSEPTPTAQAEPAPVPDQPTLGSILAESRRTLDSIATYQVRMNHQERVNGKLNPAESAILSIRRNPKAVRIAWPEGPNQGREVLYVADQNGGEGMMHIHMANSLVPTLTMSPNSPLATRNSRHPITEAGLDTILSHMEEAYQAQEKSDPSFGKITYEGLEQPDGLKTPSQKILRVTTAGERWVVYVDPATKLPCMVQANAANGDLLERYFFLDPKLELPELAQANAFDPNTRWGASKGGLFSKLAKAAASLPANATP